MLQKQKKDVLKMRRTRQTRLDGEEADEDWEPTPRATTSKRTPATNNFVDESDPTTQTSLDSYTSKDEIVEYSPNELQEEKEYIEDWTEYEEPEEPRQQKWVGGDYIPSTEDAIDGRYTTKDKIKEKLAQRRENKLSTEEAIDGPFYLYVKKTDRTWELFTETPFQTREEAMQYATENGIQSRYKILSLTEIEKFQSREERTERAGDSLRAFAGNVFSNITRPRQPRNRQTSMPPGTQPQSRPQPATSQVTNVNIGQQPSMARNFLENSYDHASRYGATADQMRTPFQRTQPRETVTQTIGQEQSRSKQPIDRSQIFRPQNIHYRPTGNIVNPNTATPRMISPEERRLRSPPPHKTKINKPQKPRMGFIPNSPLYRPPIYGERPRGPPTKEPVKPTAKKPKKKKTKKKSKRRK